MHIASALTVVRRAPVQSNAPAPRIRASYAMPVPSEQADSRAPASRSSHWRAALPGAILLAVLALLGALFPILF
jgi:hypothetical protein